MAQAARLNLRLQKELKLLFSDPPPGASFPLLSADANLSSSSLSTIHAQIEGPEGTVYAKGIFDVKIQIPDRYPFQPPTVTFATPVYHPNIDNGGRICLDILNLPPKGAWQPSLNIATVLTSIGLLLSEPNPDDGLMCEASREYKYNRQAFDQKARAMTEKYAKPGAIGEHCMAQLIQSSSEPNTEAEDKESHKQSKQESDSKKPCGFSRKLSLEYSSRAQKRDSDGKQTETLKLQQVFYPENHTEEKVERKELGGSPDHHDGGCQKLGVIKGKLSLESSAQLDKKDGKYSKLVEPKNSHSPRNLKTVFAASMESPLLQVAGRPERTLNQHLETKFTDNSKKMSLKKLCQVAQKTLSGSLDSYQTACASDEKQLEPPDVSSPQFHPTLSRGPLPLALSTNHDELQRCKDSVVRLENFSTNTIGSKAFPASKTLSLGIKASLQGQEKDVKENIMPIQRLPLSNFQTPMKIGISRKPSVAPLSQLQGTNEDSRQLQSHLQNACTNITKTQQPHNSQNMQTKEGDKQLGEQLAVAESVVVLDSEDSDEETSGSKRGSKLSLVRKRISKRKALA